LDIRDYIILKAKDSSVLNVYLGPQEKPSNVNEISTALEIVMRFLVEKYYHKGCDVIIARGQNLEDVKNSLPELHWGKYKSHNLTEFASSVPK